ncbi:hypothetical protein ACCO45_001048 [Purpureocillium lilacinum]|uniref:Uncharacterized protein n=1 Tax=Purpureocillium lilacinum TaxID=33203 RepID=A0ACC4E7C8_PURLI
MQQRIRHYAGQSLLSIWRILASTALHTLRILPPSVLLPLVVATAAIFLTSSPNSTLPRLAVRLHDHLDRRQPQSVMSVRAS